MLNVCELVWYWAVKTTKRKGWAHSVSNFEGWLLCDSGMQMAKMVHGLETSMASPGAAWRDVAMYT